MVLAASLIDRIGTGAVVALGGGVMAVEGVFLPGRCGGGMGEFKH